MNFDMKTVITFLFVTIASFHLSAQILLCDVEQKNTVAFKTGWDQSFALGINFSRNIDLEFINKPTNIQIEFISPLATSYKFYNGRASFGLQTEVFRKNKFSLTTNIFGTYSWTEDVTATIKGIGLYTSVVPTLINNKYWIFAFEFAYRPTVFARFNFSENVDLTFNDRYPGTRGNDEVPDNNGWYSFTNNKFQFALLINKKIKTNYQLGLKFGFEHFMNDNSILLNGWIGQIPLNANINLAYSF